MSLLGKARWGLFNCVTGTFTPVDKLPFEIGATDGVDLQLNGSGVSDKHCAVSQVKSLGLCLVKKDPAADLVLNGALVEMEPLATDADYAVQLGAHFLMLRGGRDLEEWRATLDHRQWFLGDELGGMSLGPLPLPELCRAAREQRRPLDAVAAPRGARMGFFLSQLLGVFDPQGLEEAALAGGFSSGISAGEAEEALFNVTPDRGSLTCPVCWLRFERGDIMHVAVHDSLRGDPLLGPDVPLRFHATRFNDRGQGLDATGLPCPEMSCPHCRRTLPPGFLDMPHHIFSIVGDQSAGKSYYLSVLIKLLPISLYRHFGAVFQDADPAGNALLNEMKKNLFSAQTPEQARLVKTQLEGAMYERLPRFGRLVALPKPFVFFIASTRAPERRCSAIFYDNAGEHFQPGRDSADSPGAQHIASSSGIFFLFDPFNHPEFRRRMEGGPDPQFEKPILDQQDVILSEMKVRIAKLLGLSLAARVRTPLAVLVGKCDAWMHLLGAEPLRNPLEDGRLNLDAVRHNSHRVRELMREVSPTVVANAEAVSEEVLYFPVSSFGHAPMKIDTGDSVPDPRRLQPVLVEVPALWLLSRVEPELVPV